MCYSKVFKFPFKNVVIGKKSHEGKFVKFNLVPSDLLIHGVLIFVVHLFSCSKIAFIGYSDYPYRFLFIIARFVFEIQTNVCFSCQIFVRYIFPSLEYIKNNLFNLESPG